MSVDWHGRCDEDCQRHEDIGAERAQWAAMEEAARFFLRMAEPCWKFGDDTGGAVFLRLRELADEMGLPNDDTVFPGARRTPKRKAVSDSVRTAVYEGDAYRCRHCGSFKDLSVDHIHPLSLGGSNDIDNLQTLCMSCNVSKRDRA